MDYTCVNYNVEAWEGRAYSYGMQACAVFLEFLARHGMLGSMLGSTRAAGFRQATTLPLHIPNQSEEATLA